MQEVVLVEIVGFAFVALFLLVPASILLCIRYKKMNNAAVENVENVDYTHAVMGDIPVVTAIEVNTDNIKPLQV